LVLVVASADSWFWHAATIDLATGVATKLTTVNLSDFTFALGVSLPLIVP
jgi:hypothetical protein